MAKTYADKLKSPRWQKKRLEIMSRDKFTCKLCGDTETQLHVHHKEYINGNDPWEYDNKLLVTLCEDCHSEIERLKKEHSELVFNKIKVHKSLWTDGSKIIFISYAGNCSMRFFNSDGDFKQGYCLDEYIMHPVIKVFKHALLNA